MLHVRVSDLLVSPLQDEEEAGFVVVVVVVGLGGVDSLCICYT